MELQTAGWARDLSKEALEAYAEEVFEASAISARIRKACQQGRNAIHIPQDRPIDLSRTEAAARICMALNQLGYRTQWEDMKYVEHASRHESGREYLYCELAIQWNQSIYG